jgi:energy-coupling factor transporter ATP-binding protein EcfA2
MIELTGLSLVNWHLFTAEDISFAGNSAILGKNASGKSTLIDMIQTVMTGGSGGFYRYNQSAGEGSGQSERTLRGYCLGQTDQGVSRRQQGVTHIALKFAGPARTRPVTLGLCIEVGLNEEARIVGRYVADGVAAGRDDLVEMKDGAPHPAPWAAVRARLKLACQKAGGDFFEHQPPTAARVFIREYMRVLFTGRRQPDADRFIKAFIMALSFEEMKSVEAFVQRYLLAKDDINIAELRDSIQRYQQIQRDIVELEKKLTMLKPVAVEIQRFEGLLEQEDVGERLRRLAMHLSTAKELFAVLAQRRAKLRELASRRDELQRIGEEIALTEQEAISVRAQIDATGAEAQRHALRQEIELSERDRQALIGRLRARHQPVANALELLQHRDRLQAMGVGLGPLSIVLEQIGRESQSLAPPAWPKDPALMEQLIENAAAAATERIERVEAKRDETTALRVDSQKRITELTTQLGETQQGRVALHPKTLSLMENLRAAGFKPRALCEVIDIADESWREAAEALLGRDREAIIVDPEHAEQAVSMLRRERDRYQGCRIANTRKLVSAPHHAAPGTLASTIGSADAIAMAFVVFRLGNVRLAEHQADLLSQGRAIMRDGSYYDGLVVEIRRPDGIKIGRVAASLMSDVIRRDIDSERQILETYRRNEGFLGGIYQRLVFLGVAVPPAERLDTIAIALTQAEDRRADLKTRFDNVSLQIDPKLRDAQTRFEASLRNLREEVGDHQRAIGGLESELSGLEVRLGAGAGSGGSRMSFRYHRSQFRERVRSVTLLRHLRPIFVERRGETSDARFAERLAEELERLEKARQQSDATIRDDVVRYCLAFAAQHPFNRDSKVIGDIKPWVDETIALLEGNDLVRYRRQADEAAERITYLFRSSFVHELNSRFRSLETEIDDLKTALRSNRLHGEVYSLHAQVRPEFRPLYDLARASESDDRVLALLFSSVPEPDHPLAAAITQVESLLRDPDARFEVYQDYRNYYNFDLRMRDADGHETSYDRRRGVASGAERQVPFYVIIGAALSSIYHGTRRSPDAELGLGLAVFDEAFSKMDGQNQRTMLQFYNQIGLQVVIAAPTEKRAVVYENLDSVIDVYRFGRFAELEVSRIKQRARQAMWDANPEHLSDEDLLLRMADAAPESEPVGDQADEAVH